MPGHPLSEAKCREVVEAMRETNGNKSAAARLLGIPYATLQSRLAAAERQGHSVNGKPQFTAHEPPSPDVPIAELVRRKTEDEERHRKSAQAANNTAIDFHVDGPLGIMWFGDPHTDNPKSQYRLLLDHTKAMASCEGMYGASVGDYNDNWIGRLGRLYAESAVTAHDGIRLTEHWIKQGKGKFVLLVKGNHDNWNATISGHDPIKWLSMQHGFVTHSFQLIVTVRLPAGQPYRIMVRHRFKGHSMFHALQGEIQAARAGHWHDLLVSGHTHEAGHLMDMDAASGHVTHLMKAAGYKGWWDSYALDGGFRRRDQFETGTVLLDPAAHDPRYRLRFEPDPIHACERLSDMRRRWKRKNK